MAGWPVSHAWGPLSSNLVLLLLPGAQEGGCEGGSLAGASCAEAVARNPPGEAVCLAWPVGTSKLQKAGLMAGPHDCVQPAGRSWTQELPRAGLGHLAVSLARPER